MVPLQLLMSKTYNVNIIQYRLQYSYNLYQILAMAQAILAQGHSREPLRSFLTPSFSLSPFCPVLSMTDGNGDLKMEDGEGDGRVEDDSPLHAAKSNQSAPSASCVPSASDLAAAAAALAAAVGNTVDLTTETPGPNPYQLAAMNASSGTPRGPTSKAESPNDIKIKTPAKKQQGSKTASPEKRPKLAAPTPVPSRAPIPPPGLREPPVFGGNCSAPPTHGHQAEEPGRPQFYDLDAGHPAWVHDLREMFQGGQREMLSELRTHTHKASTRLQNRSPISIRDSKKWQASRSVFKTALMKWKRR